MNFALWLHCTQIPTHLKIQSTFHKKKNQKYQRRYINQFCTRRDYLTFFLREKEINGKPTSPALTENQVKLLQHNLWKFTSLKFLKCTIFQVLAISSFQVIDSFKQFPPKFFFLRGFASAQHSQCNHLMRELTMVMM